MDGAVVFPMALEVGAAALVTWLTWRAANGSLPRNSLAGVRTSITMSSEAAWQIGHRAALRPTIISGLLVTAWCAISIGVPALRTPAAVLVAAGLLVGGALLSVPAAHRAVRRALPEAGGDGAHVDGSPTTPSASGITDVNPRAVRRYREDHPGTTILQAAEAVARLEREGH
ncbi:SdpI family protein [Curtobacterium caseinilyticum]|uniref:SdpI family protein n=1 Tax=Curtobacterium caseinilyticum TaxID=3055137 RepID=A0ABT7TTJ9_9MICO|nr:SdpI family protein [Curtobacterium caseinilyticum]MDM7892945.1 SdpI family protein [Curtobacterium caseinilyticum]